MPKVRIYSILLFCIIMALLSTVIPTQFFRVAPPIRVEKPEVLELSCESVQAPSDVIAVCIPISLEAEAVGEKNPGSSERNANENLVQNINSEQEKMSSGVSVETSVPASAEAAADSGVKNASESGTDVPGAYPESRFLEKTNSSSVNSVNSSPETPIETTSVRSALPDSADVFSSSFLNESPMLESRKFVQNSRMTHIGQSSGENFHQNAKLNVIPNQPGVNGRSLSGPREHIIEDGDSLEKIAARYFGDTERSGEIFEKNREKLSSEDELPIGVVLVIPDRE